MHIYENQSRDSPTSSAEVVVEEPTYPTEGFIFISSIGEQLLGQELEVPIEEEE